MTFAIVEIEFHRTTERADDQVEVSVAINVGQNGTRRGDSGEVETTGLCHVGEMVAAIVMIQRGWMLD